MSTVDTLQPSYELAIVGAGPAGMAAAASAPVTAAIVGNRTIFPMLLGFALLVIWKHRENIQRLAKGQQPRLGRKQA